MHPATYSAYTRPHRRILQQLQVELGFFIEDMGDLHVHSLETRIKTFASAQTKSEELGIPIRDLQDLAGLRIVVATRAEVDILRRFFARQESVGDLKIKSDRAIRNESGYRSWHVVIAFEGSYKRSVQSGRIEVQIPTIFEHSFNLVSRSWLYKSSIALSNDWHRSFLELSNNLANLDDLAASLHLEFAKTAAKTLPEGSLTPLSYIHLVDQEFKETVDFDEAVDSCWKLKDFGRYTNEALLSWLRDSRIEQLWTKFNNLANSGSKRAANFVKTKRGFWHIAGMITSEWIWEQIKEIEDELAGQSPKNAE